MEIRDILLLISMIGHFSYTAWAYIERRNDKSNEKISELTTKLGEVEKDMASLKQAADSAPAISAKIGEVEKKMVGLKQAVESAPSHHDLGKVYESINTLAATVNQLVGENRGQTDTLRLILNRLTGGG